jgi:integrase/recombinase XerD
VARALAAVRGFHRFLVRERLAGADPSRDLGTPKVPASLPKALSVEQVEALLGAIAGHDQLALRDRALLETLYAAGLRVSEATALDVDDLDLEDGTVRAFGKGAKERLVPIGRSARGPWRPTWSGPGPCWPGRARGRPCSSTPRGAG